MSNKQEVLLADHHKPAVRSVIRQYRNFGNKFSDSKAKKAFAQRLKVVGNLYKSEVDRIVSTVWVVDNFPKETKTLATAD